MKLLGKRWGLHASRRGLTSEGKRVQPTPGGPLPILGLDPLGTTKLYKSWSLTYRSREVTGLRLFSRSGLLSPRSSVATLHISMLLTAGHLLKTFPGFQTTFSSHCLPGAHCLGGGFGDTFLPTLACGGLPGPHAVLLSCSSSLEGCFPPHKSTCPV